MKAIKLAAIVLGGIAVLLLVLVVLLSFIFNSTRIKAAITEAVLEKTQRTLQIDGDIDLRFWPNLGVEIGKARLSEFRSAQEFAAIDSARISVEVPPLLSRKIVVDTIEIDGARVALVKRKDGSLNIDDLTGQQPASPATAAPSSAAIEVAAARLNNTRLTWRDEGSSESIISANLDLATGRIIGDTGAGSYSVDALTLALAVNSGENRVTMKLALPRVALTNDAARTVALDKIEGSLELAGPKLQRPVHLPLAGQLRADLAKESFDGALSSRLDGSTVALKFDVARFAPLDLGFALDIDRLNADQYLAPDDKTDDDENGIDLSALKGLNIHGTLRIGELQVANVKSRNIRLVIGEGR